MRQFRILLPLPIIAFALVACGAGNAGRIVNPVAAISPTTSIAAPGRVEVTEHDFALSLDSAAATPGQVALSINNTGPSAHELLVFQTDLPADKLPLGSDGRVNEDALQKVFDTGTDLPPGTQRQVTANLPAGRYVLICNLPAHYLAGMRTVLTVK